MELLHLLLGRKKEETRKTIADYQREALVKQAQKQFKKLHDLGLNIPVRLA